MKKVDYCKELLKEKEKLVKLVDEALENGINLIEDEVLMEQNRKVDELVLMVQRDMLKKKNPT